MSQLIPRGRLSAIGINSDRKLCCSTRLIQMRHGSGHDVNMICAVQKHESSFSSEMSLLWHTNSDRAPWPTKRCGTELCTKKRTVSVRLAFFRRPKYIRANRGLDDGRTSTTFLQGMIVIWYSPLCCMYVIIHDLRIMCTATGWSHIVVSLLY